MEIQDGRKIIRTSKDTMGIVNKTFNAHWLAKEDRNHLLRNVITKSKKKPTLL